MTYRFNIYGNDGKNTLMQALGNSANGDTIVLECSSQTIKDAADKLAECVREQLSELGKSVTVETVLL